MYNLMCHFESTIVQNKITYMLQDNMKQQKEQDCRVIDTVCFFSLPVCRLAYDLPTNVRLVKAMVFPAVMYGCESWTVKKAEHRRIDAFELWCWRRLLRVPWTARRSNQSILKEISPGCSLEGMKLKLKLQYFGHLNAKS